jgi:hypothetical protein
VSARHLRQHRVEFASLHTGDDSFDCGDELFFLSDRDRSLAAGVLWKCLLPWQLSNGLNKCRDF